MIEVTGWESFVLQGHLYGAGKGRLVGAEGCVSVAADGTALRIFGHPTEAELLEWVSESHRGCKADRLTSPVFLNSIARSLPQRAENLVNMLIASSLLARPVAGTGFAQEYLTKPLGNL